MNTIYRQMKPLKTKIVPTSVFLIAIIAVVLNFDSGNSISPEAQITTAAHQTASTRDLIRLTSLQSERTEAVIRKEYEEVVESFRQSVKDAQTAVARFNLEDRRKSKEWRGKYGVAIASAERTRQQMIPLAIELFEAVDKPDDDLLLLIRRIQIEAFDTDQFDRCYQLCERLIAIDSKDETAILNKGLAAIMLGKFNEAIEFRETNGVLLNDVEGIGKTMFDQLDILVEKHERELAYQKTDAEGEPLPQVEIKTTKGTIVVELFENQAPVTVGNFVSLVDAGFYNDVIFHRVITKFMAQTGGMTSMDRGKSPGYNIYDEHEIPDARSHFRGSLSMANTGDPNSGSSQFFINILPTIRLDGKHTVFGRMISGWDVLDRLNRNIMETEEGEKIVPGVTPDKIISATVLKKRQHEYVPNEVKTR